ncbi:MAG TPA: response regulator transcription factor [Terriglobales bacterium]|nr:response regulator transcription factor [Terriglobales bacterium]
MSEIEVYSPPKPLITPSHRASPRVLVTDTVAMSCRLLADELHRREHYPVAAAASPKKVFRLLAGGSFEIVLIGIGSSENPLERIRLVRQIRSLHPELNMIVLLDSLERSIVVEVFRSGAQGVFCRMESFETLCKCIRCVHEGQVWAGSGELRLLLEALVDEGRPIDSSLDGPRALSQREQQITRLVAEGYSNRQISQQLQLSEHTIKNYLFRVFEKLGVSTRVELTLYALKQTKVLGQDQQKKPASFSPDAFPDKLPGISTSN